MIVASDFRPAPWLRGPHRQTLFASKLRPPPAVAITHERLELEDGDFLDLAWHPDNGAAADAPLVVLLHGLSGSIKSKYVRGMLRAIAARGWRGVLMHFRGASGEPNRLPRSYHSGETGDLGQVLPLLQARYPRAPMAAVGYSLGGNVLLKYLGERGRDTPLQAAAAVSVPFDLGLCVRAVSRGLSRAYQHHMVGNMRTAAARKFAAMPCPVPLPDLNELRDFVSFDNAVTAPLHGFKDAEDYYRRASSRPFLNAIKLPTLIVHALDDPFMDASVVPAESELSPAVRFELSPRGGHVGFVAAGAWGQPLFWLERRIPEYLEDSLAVPHENSALQLAEA